MEPRCLQKPLKPRLLNHPTKASLLAKLDRHQMLFVPAIQRPTILTLTTLTPITHNPTLLPIMLLYITLIPIMLL